MQSVIRKVIIPVALGLAGYAAIKLLVGEWLQLSGAVAEIAVMAIIAIACVASALLAGGGGTAATGAQKEAGTVKWFDARKGYGFITRDQGDDVFVHFRNVKGNDRQLIAEGQRVSFIVTSGGKGPQAEKVTPI